MYKTCTKCDQKLSTSMFTKRSDKKDGLTKICKPCKALQDRAYKNSSNGLITDIYIQQTRNSKLRNHNPQSYSKKFLISWLKNDWYFQFLYEQWSNMNYPSHLKPSVDRLNNKQGYTKDNIQITTWGLNKLLYLYAEPDNKHASSTPVGKRIYQYNKARELLLVYNSISEASKAVGTDRGYLSKVVKSGNIYKEHYYYAYKA